MSVDRGGPWRPGLTRTRWHRAPTVCENPFRAISQRCEGGLRSPFPSAPLRIAQNTFCPRELIHRIGNRLPPRDSKSPSQNRQYLSAIFPHSFPLIHSIKINLFFFTFIVIHSSKYRQIVLKVKYKIKLCNL